MTYKLSCVFLVRCIVRSSRPSHKILSNTDSPVHFLSVYPKLFAYLIFKEFANLLKFAYLTNDTIAKWNDVVLILGLLFAGLLLFSNILINYHFKTKLLCRATKILICTKFLVCLNMRRMAILKRYQFQIKNIKL